MDGSLTTWHAGQPVLIDNSTNDMSTWYAGQPYVNCEVIVVVATAWIPKIIFID
jgi:hypothetical protein